MTSKSSSIDFDAAINTYYKLKQKYDIYIRNEVKKIRLSPDLTTKQKQEKFSEFKKRCIGCKKNGGTIFRQEGTNLIAQCGNTDKPCKLDIHLQRAKYMPMYNVIQILNTEINNKKAEIIQTKLNFLFGFSSEKDTVATFNYLKSQLVEEVKKYQKINEKYMSIIHDLPNRDEINKLNITLKTLIHDFKNLIKQYDETSDNQYLKDASNLYANQMVKVIKELQKLKYSVQTICSNLDDDDKHLVQNIYKPSQLQLVVPGTENKIIKFTV